MGIEQKGIWRPFTQMQTAPDPIEIVRGEGALLYDAQGHALIDAISSWWVNLHGHCHPALTKALAHQAEVLQHVIFAGFTHEPAEKLAKVLLQMMPAMDRVFYSDNGSTAVEVGLKMALQYWHNQGVPRKGFISLRGGYHGDTFGAMAVGDGGTFAAPFADLFFETRKIAVPTSDNIGRVAEELDKLCGTGDYAGFVFEPLVQGVAGFRMYSPDHLDLLLGICASHGVLTIADEVMTGFGRTGKLFATDYCKTKPNIVCLSKGITGGVMPLAATLCDNLVFETFLSDSPDKAFYHGHSYTANPIGCRVALASAELLLASEQRREEIAHRFRQEVENLRGIGRVRDVRSIGCIFALDLAVGADSYFNTVRTKVGPFFKDRGVLLRPLGNTLYVLPPYCISDQQLDQVFGGIKEFIDGLG